MPVRFIFQPIHQCGAINPGQKPAFGVPVMIGRGIPRRLPHQINGFSRHTQAFGQVLRQGQMSHRRPDRILVGFHQIQPHPNGRPDTVANFHRFDVHRCQAVHHVAVSQGDKMLNHLANPGGKQAVHFHFRPAQFFGSGAQRGFTPAVKRNMLQGGAHQFVALLGDAGKTFLNGHVNSPVAYQCGPKHPAGRGVIRR